MATEGFSQNQERMHVEEGELSRLKKPKRVKGLEDGGNVDIISNLPDNLLHHILSFLPTDSAVSTFILAKRWKNLWMSTTNLDFDSHDSCRPRYWPLERFCQFIKQVLIYHCSNITRFNLHCFWKVDPILIDSWISAAVQRQVQEISLLYVPQVVSLPSCLCTSKILRVLEVWTRYDLCLPSMISLPSLKILRLRDVCFVDDHSFVRLFSGLPCIEELALHHCEWDNIKNVAISLPTLRRFSNEFGNDCLNEDCVVKVNAENLLNLSFTSDLTNDLILDTMPSLAHAKVVIANCYSKENRRVVQHAANLFSALSFSKSLHIKVPYPWTESWESCCTLQNINIVPMFVNLTTLRVEFEIKRPAAALLITIFQNAPLLESLVIEGQIRGGKWSRKPQPRSIEFSLKKCSLLCFDGRMADILFVKFLLKTAKALEVLKIHCSLELRKEQGKLEDIKKKIEAVSRASECCMVEFLDMV